MALIDLQDVTKDYQRGARLVSALRGVTLSVDAQEFVAVWGPSGSGKSTLANLMGMLDHPTSGRVRFGGEDVSGLRDDRRSELRSQQFGFVFQSFNLVPVLTALENVMLPLEILGQGQIEARARASQRLDELGLGFCASSRPESLSGGEQQRVGIARALVTEPSVIIADEPTANLDTESALSLIRLMRQINGQEGTTFIVSTHDERLLEHASRRVLLRDGLVADDVTGT